MPKKTIQINKTNQLKINRWLKGLSNRIQNIDILDKQFHETVINEMKQLKECSEKNIIQFYMDRISSVIDNMESDVWDEDLMKSTVTPIVRSSLAIKYTANQTFDNNIDIYFNEVKREYILHPMNESDDLEFLPENRDIFIKNNLKLVINCAKRYRGLGLPFEDLIQIGNYGLLVAFDKFDKDRANLRIAIMNAIDESGLDTFEYDEAVRIIKSSFSYDKDLDRTLKLVPTDGFETVETFKDWVYKNIKTAVFASVAFQWIRAYILLELSKLSQVVRIPKSSKSSGSDVSEQSQGPSIISLDSINPHTDDNYHDNTIAGIANERFLIEDEAIDKEDNDVLFRKIIFEAMRPLSEFERRIIKKKFGIGFPYAMSINEIAESEGMQQNKVKYILTSCIKEISNNISKRDKEMLADILM